MLIQSRKSQSSCWLSSTSISVESVVKGYHVFFKEVWNRWREDKFNLQVEEFNCCNHYSDRYAVAIVVDEESVGHVLTDMPKLENYNEIRSRLYNLSFSKLMEADNSFLGKKYLF